MTESAFFFFILEKQYYVKFMQSNQYEYTESLKYGDNQGHFIILWSLIKSRSIAVISDSDGLPFSPMLKTPQLTNGWTRGLCGVMGCMYAVNDWNSVIKQYNSLCLVG